MFCKLLNIAFATVFLRILRTNFHMEFFLLQTTDTNNAANYLPIALQMLFAVGLIATIIVGSNLLGPKRATSDKLQNFESGIQIRGNARQPMAVKYFLVAINPSPIYPSGIPSNLM